MNPYFQTPPVVKNLIIINVLAYMATMLLPVATRSTACSPSRSGLRSFWAWSSTPTSHHLHVPARQFRAHLLQHVRSVDVRPYAGVETGLEALPHLLHGLRHRCGADPGRHGLAGRRTADPACRRVGCVMGLLLAFGVMHPNAVIMLLIPPIPLRQMVRHHLRRDRTLPRLDRLRRQCGPLRSCGRHAVGLPAAAVVEA